MRKTVAWKLRRFAEHLWRYWGLGEIRYLSELDYAMVNVVARLDALANRLDPPW